jgi:hypothetical protein
MPAPLFPSVSIKRKYIPGSCKVSGGALCYDYRNGSSVCKPYCEFMPEISDVQCESLGPQARQDYFQLQLHVVALEPARGVSTSELAAAVALTRHIDGGELYRSINARK